MFVRLSIALIGLTPALAQAVPMVLTHQLRLLDAAGMPVGGAHDVGVALWTAGAGGVMTWSETQRVTVDSGYVALRLGADAANPLTDAILDGAALWVGVTVDGGAELPTRSPIGAVPYSVRAGTADAALSATTALSANAVPATGTVDVGALRQRS